MRMGLEDPVINELDIHLAFHTDSQAWRPLEVVDSAWLGASGSQLS